jgi:hypothetical protein
VKIVWLAGVQIRCGGEGQSLVFTVLEAGSAWRVGSGSEMSGNLAHVSGKAVWKLTVREGEHGRYLSGDSS